MMADEEGIVPPRGTNTCRGGSVESVVGYGAIAGICCALVLIGCVGGVALLINEISRGLAWGYIAFCIVIGMPGMAANSRRRRSSTHASTATSQSTNPTPLPADTREAFTSTGDAPTHSSSAASRS
jgi:hypothetical protein